MLKCFLWKVRTTIRWFLFGWKLSMNYYSPKKIKKVEALASGNNDVQFRKKSLSHSTLQKMQEVATAGS